MQVNSVNNYQSNNTPHFTAFKVKPNSINTFMDSLADECDADGLLKVSHIIEGQLLNSNHIYMIDGEAIGGLPSLSYFEAKINGSLYENGNFLNTKAWNFRKFLAYLAKQAEKNNPHPESKNVKNALKLEQEAELLRQKASRLRGTETEEQQKEKLLFHIRNVLLK